MSNQSYISQSAAEIDGGNEHRAAQSFDGPPSFAQGPQERSRYIKRGELDNLTQVQLFRLDRIRLTNPVRPSSCLKCTGNESTPSTKKGLVE